VPEEFFRTLLILPRTGTRTIQRVEKMARGKISSRSKTPSPTKPKTTTLQSLHGKKPSPSSKFAIRAPTTEKGEGSHVMWKPPYIKGKVTVIKTGFQRHVLQTPHVCVRYEIVGLHASSCQSNKILLTTRLRSQLLPEMLVVSRNGLLESAGSRFFSLRVRKVY
jgi:hypothetical protein